MLYAIDKVNNDSNLLRGMKLGALIMDSCSTPAFALNQSLDFVRDLIGTSDLSGYQCSDGRAPVDKQSFRKSVAAVVGGSYSSVTVQVANLLRLFQIAQISPASTNNDLSDKKRFEFFARTVPSDHYQARAMVSIAREFNWTYVSLLYTADEYGDQGADSFKVAAKDTNNGTYRQICIDDSKRVDTEKEKETKKAIHELMQKMQTSNDYGWGQVIVLFANTDSIQKIMNITSQVMEEMGEWKVNGKKKKIIWLASEGWDRNNKNYMVDSLWKAADGAIVLMLKSPSIPGFDEYYKSLRPGTPTFDRNSWLKELWREKYNCRFSDDPEWNGRDRCEKKMHTGAFHADDKVQFTINAVYAIAYALDAMYRDECPSQMVQNTWITRNSPKILHCDAMNKIDGTKFYKNYLLKVNFNEGDGPASYTILNYQPDLDEKGNIDLNSTKAPYVEVGEWLEGKLTINHSLMHWNVRNDELPEDKRIKNPQPASVCMEECKPHQRKQITDNCCWACVDCHPYQYKPNETTCVDCELGLKPSFDWSRCVKVEKLVYMEWGTPYAIVPSIMATLGIVATLFVIGVFTPVVKASGRELSYILLGAMILCYMMTFVLLAKPSAVTCGIKRIGIGFAFSTLYAAMFVKTNRIARIFAQATRTAVRPCCISPLSQVGLTAALVGFQLGYCLIWLMVKPAGVKEDFELVGRFTAVLTCNVPDHHFLYSLIYDVILVVLCTVYAVKTRQVPENFNETKFIGFSMYTTCVLWVAWISFYFGTKSNFMLQISSLSICISMSANVALVCIFSPKVWIILFEKHKNVRKPDGEYMLSKRSFNNNRANSTYLTSDEPSQYTALLAEQRRKSEYSSTRKLSQPSTGSSAQDTFL
ncbi:hypothetical protein PMAYCL1PPCAC_30382 [Pristionchus mayeri]|uniref:G-protein coupled receptors family 3 profile domain-containing protein n=1 Tax=Pristionchus mayeri TaxID=1317129 RepID=A0AAN5DDH0_9BILA|nr:hypothetical protein PMAYCL1PPCAC_30382 [Pristionchus mayeri]